MDLRGCAEGQGRPEVKGGDFLASFVLMCLGCLGEGHLNLAGSGLVLASRTSRSQTRKCVLY